MRALRFIGFLLGALVALGSGCSKLTRTNPFDEKSPESLQATAKLAGRVALEGQGAFASVTISAVEAREGEAAGRRVETVAQDDGQFLLEVPSDTYGLTFSAPGHQDVSVTNIHVRPGERYDLGSTLLLVARGRLSGRVFQNDGATATRGASRARAGTKTAAGATVIIARADGEGSAYTTVTGPDGSYESDAVPEGDYVVRASRDDYAPAYVVDPITVGGSAAAAAPDLTLYPASAVVHLLAGGVVGAQYTNQRTLEAQLLAFVQFLTEMRVSEDPSFVGVDWTRFVAATPFTLGDVDGLHTVYAQFRDKSGLESDVFSASILLDRDAPDVVSVQGTINGGYVTQSAFDLSVAGVDRLSGVRGYQTTLTGDFSSAPEQSALASGSSVLIGDLVSLGADGAKTVSVRLVDRAGNVSEPKGVSFLKDTTPPAVISPAFVVGDGSGTLRAQTVPLIFNVTGSPSGEPLFVALGTAPGLSAASPRQPVSLVGSFTFSAGDGAKTLCVYYSDAAGNGTDGGCQYPVLDRSGALSGTVFVEGEAGGGVDVIVYPEGNPGGALPVFTTVDPTPPAGAAFTIAGIPAGPRYVLQLSKNGFNTVVDRDIDIVPGVTPLDRGRYDLFVAKGTVSGKVELSDGIGNVHGGIVVADQNRPSIATVTGPDGSWAMSVPVGNFTFQASKKDYIPRNYALVTVTANGSFPLLPNPLKIFPQVGAFRICRAIQEGCPPAATAEYTEQKTVHLALQRTTASHFYSSLSSGANPGVSAFTAPIGSDVAGALDGAGAAEADFVLDELQPDGSQTIYVWYLLPGNVVDGPVSSSITLDRAPPVPTRIALDDGAKFSRDGTPVTGAARVTLHLAATDAHSGVASVLLSREDEDYDDGLPAGADDVRAFASAIADYPLATGEGTRTVYVAFCDVVGNCTCPVDGCSPTDTILRSDSITVDRVAPVGARFAINDVLAGPGLVGADYTTTPFVVLEVENPGADATAVRFSLTDTFDGLPWQPLSGATARLPFVLSGGEGTKEVFAQFIDEAGNSTGTGGSALSDDIDLDFTAPSGTVRITSDGNLDLVYRGDADLEGDLDMVLALAWAGADKMRVHVGQSADFSGESWEDVAPTKALNPVLADGIYGVYVQFRDAAGNESLVATDTVVFDTQAPTFGRVSALVPTASDGKKYVKPGVVTLDLFAVGADKMTLSVDGTPLPSQPETYSIRRDVSLGASGVARVLGVSFADFAGNTAALVGDTLYVDGSAPSLATFSAAASVTREDRVLVTLEATDLGPIEMRLSPRSDFQGAGWQPLSSPLLWPLSVEGNNDVNVKLRDAAGNELTVLPITIARDTTAPAGVSLSLAGGGAAVQSPSNVTVAIGATGAVDYRLSEDPSFSGVAWVTPGGGFPVVTDFDFAAGDGLRVLYLGVRDAAGNVTSASDTVELDTRAPESPTFSLVSTLAADPSGYTTTASIMVSLGVVGATQYCLDGPIEGDSSDGCASDGWSATTSFPRMVTLGLTGLDASKTVTAYYRDAVGWTTSGTSAVIVYDSTKPSGTVSIDDGSFTDTVDVGLAITASDTLAGIASMIIANGATCSGGLEVDYVTSRSWQLSSGDDTKTVAVCFKDRAGNVSDPVTDTVTLDTTAPASVSLDVNSGGAYILSVTNVPLQVAATDTNALSYQLSEDPNFADVSGWTVLALSPTVTDWDFSSGEGVKALYLRVRDAAGNLGYSADSVVLDTENPLGEKLTLAPSTFTQTTTGVVASFFVQGASYYCLYGDITGAPTALQCSDPAYAGWLALTSTTSLTLASGDGTKTVRVRFKDAAGRLSPEATAQVLLDGTPPDVVRNPPGTPSLTVDLLGLDLGGFRVTGVTSVPAIQVELPAEWAIADATSGVTEVQVSEDASFADAVWQDFSSAFSFVLSSGDAAKTVRVRVRDAAGNISSARTASMILDTTPPAVAVAIGGVGPDSVESYDYTREVLGRVLLDVNDGTGVGVGGATDATLRISNDSTFTGVTAEPYDDKIENWDLRGPDFQRYHTGLWLNELVLGAFPVADVVEVRNNLYMDVSLAGWTLRCRSGAGAELSQSLPGTTLLSEGNTASANLMQVSLPCDVQAGVPAWIALYDPLGNVGDYVRVNDPTATFTPPTGQWAGDLTCAVACQRTSLLVDRNLSSDFCVDTTPGTNTLGADNDESCGLLTTTLLPSVDGTAQVFVRVKDLAGNETAASASIVIDTAPPTLALVLDDGADVTRSLTVAARVDVADALSGVHDLWLTHDPTVAGLGPEPYVAVHPYTFPDPGADAVQTLYARVRDAAGNESPAFFVSDAIIYDPTGPDVSAATMTLTGEVEIDNDAAPETSTTDTRSQVVQVSLDNVSFSGTSIAEMIVSESGTFADAAWQPAAITGPATPPTSIGFPWVLSPTDGAKTLYLKLRDVAGNESIRVDATIQLDTTPPDTGVISVNDDDAYANAGPLSVRFYLNETTPTATAYRLVPGPPVWTACSGGSCDTATPGEAFSFALMAPPPPQGNTRVQLVVRDAVGNVSAPFFDDIFVDTLPPLSQPNVVGIAPRTTSAFVSLTETTDDTSEGAASGIASYHVCIYTQSAGTLYDEVDFAPGSGGGWITDLEALDVYFFYPQAVDAAGNTQPAGACPATTPSGTVNSQVGVNTGLIEGVQKIATLGDRIHSHRGVVLFPRVNNDVAPARSEIVRCDTRRERCQDAGLSVMTEPVSDTAVERDVAMASHGNEVWLFRVNDNGTVHLHATVFDQTTDALLSGSEYGAGFDTGASMTAGRFVPGTLAATSNGRVLAAAWFEHTDSGAPMPRVKLPRPDVLKVAVCQVGTGCRQAAHWRTVVLMDGATDPVGPGPGIVDDAWELAADLINDGMNTVNYVAPPIAIEAGEHELWLGFPAYNSKTSLPAPQDSCLSGAWCSFAVLSCSISGSADACTTQADWGVSGDPLVVTGAKLSHPTSPGGFYPHAARLLDTQGRLNVMGLASTMAPGAGSNQRGLFTWRCDASAPSARRCTASGDYSAGAQLLQLNQPVLFSNGFPVAPRVAVEAWGGFLNYAAVDYATGIVFFGRCEDGAGPGCIVASNWSNAKLLTSGDIRGQADLAIVQGNPIVFVGRDATRAFVMEAYSPAPLNRALVPSFAGQGSLATWSVRDPSAAEGYLIATNVTSPLSPPTSLLLAPDVSTSELELGGGTSPVYGTVTSYRGFDTGIAEPVFTAAGGAVTEITTADISQTLAPHLARSATCDFALFVADNKLELASRLTGTTAWAYAEVEPKRLAGNFAIGELALSPIIDPQNGKDALLFAYTYDGGSGDDALVVEWYPVEDADCALDTTTERKVTFNETGVVPRFRSVSIGVAGASRVFVAHEVGAMLPASDIFLKTCDLTTLCDDGVTDWTALSWNAADYSGGGFAYASAGDRVYWLANLAPTTPSATGVRVLTCTGATGCDDVTEWTSLVTLPESIFTPYPGGAVRPQTGAVERRNGYLTMTSGSRVAYCNLAASGCDRAADWTTTFYSAELLGASEHNMGTLTRAPAGVLTYVGLGNDGHAVAKCKDRCWLADNWMGGFANKRPEVTVTQSQGYPFFGASAYIDDTGAMSALFGFRYAADPFRIYLRYVFGARFDYTVAP